MLRQISLASPQPVKRVIVFGSMITISAGILLIRSMSIVLLGLIGRNWAFGYVRADVGLYLIIKVSRGDFWYWIPAGENTEKFVYAFARLTAKVITDFTYLVQERRQQEIGGAS